MSKNERHIFIGVLLVLAAALAAMLLQDTLAGRPQEIRRVAVLLDGADESYWQSFRLGVDKAAREHNVDVRYVFRFDGPADGESAFKECRDIAAENCFFNLRYPFWHVEGLHLRDSEMTKNCRAALWYDRGVDISDCKMNGIKALRECTDIRLKDVTADSPEFGWKCKNIDIEGGDIRSEYAFLESSSETGL